MVARPRAVRLAVDDDAALAADPLAAVVVEGDRLLAPRDQPLVDHVEHLEERHVGADVAGLVGHEPPLGLAVLLPPDVQGQVDRLLAAVAAHRPASLLGSDGRMVRATLDSLVAPRLELDVLEGRAARRGGSGGLPSPVYSQAATWQKCSSSRAASPSAVWYSSRKWPPHDSRRSRASRQSSSPSSRKSATRPAFSSDWFTSLAVAQDADVLPELLAQRGDLLEGRLQALLVAGHAAVVPHDLAQLAVERVDRPPALDAQQRLEPGVQPRLGVLERGVVGRRPCRACWRRGSCRACRG